MINFEFLSLNSTTADGISSLFPQLGVRLSEPDQFPSVIDVSKSYPFKVVGTKSVLVTHLFSIHNKSW